MDRKSFFKKLNPERQKKSPIGSTLNSDKISEPIPVPDLMPLNNGLAPYSGSWGRYEIRHLLKRLTFGAPAEDVKFLEKFTYSEAVDLLLNSPNPKPGEPLKHYTHVLLDGFVPSPKDDEDWGVPIGKTWVNAVSRFYQINKLRVESVKCWWMNLMINQPRSIEEKMILFWTTHFAIEFDQMDNGIFCYRYLKMLRDLAVGDFKELTRQMTLSSAMLIYLNGRYNNKIAPDENYARELQELFTLGKGPGSQYTEDDVKAAARVLTGWTPTDTGDGIFRLERHDTGDKQFSSFFNNTIIKGQNNKLAGERELSELLDMIFEKEEVSKYMCRRFYRFFVFGNIDETVENEIIIPLAETFRNNNYQVKPVLEQLFKSEHFFDVLTHGSMIKSPIDLVVGAVRDFKVKFPPFANTKVYYAHMLHIIQQAEILDQSIGEVPNVSGWPAYYQHPLYDLIWIDTNTLIKRQYFVSNLLKGFTNAGQQTMANVLELAKRMPDASDPEALVKDLVEHFLGIPLQPETLERMKVDLLLSGQISNYYWTNAWNAYLANPSDPILYNNMYTRLNNLVGYIMNMEEYQLM